MNLPHAPLSYAIPREGRCCTRLRGTPAFRVRRPGTGITPHAGRFGRLAVADPVSRKYLVKHRIRLTSSSTAANLESSDESLDSRPAQPPTPRSRSQGRPGTPPTSRSSAVSAANTSWSAGWPSPSTSTPPTPTARSSGTARPSHGPRGPRLHPLPGSRRPDLNVSRPQPPSTMAFHRGIVHRRSLRP